MRYLQEDDLKMNTVETKSRKVAIQNSSIFKNTANFKLDPPDDVIPRFEIFPPF